MQPELQPVQNNYAPPVSARQGVSASQKVLRNTYLLLALSMACGAISAQAPIIDFVFMRPSRLVDARWRG